MEELLKKFDFSNKEVVVYKALLGLGGATVSKIAKHTGIKRTSCQEYIRSIMERGFINSSKIGNKYYYQAEDPDRFRQIVNEREFVVDRLLNDLGESRIEEEWMIKLIKEDEARQEIKREWKKSRPDLNINYKNDSIYLFANKKIILLSSKEEIGSLEIISDSMGQFHKDIILRKNKK